MSDKHEVVEVRRRPLGNGHPLGAVITTKAASGASGTWLIDPTNFPIANGRAARRASGIGADTLAKALGNGNVTIVTATAGHQAGNMVEPSASGPELP
jgi:hypothetical protein